jgi:hypothetical protein
MYRRLLVVVCVLTGALCLTGVAQASDASVRSAIESANKHAKESPELQGALTELKSDPKSIAKLQTGLKEFESALRKVASTVGSQHASTAKGKEGEAKWLGGIHKVIRGFEYIGTALTDIKAHNKTAAKAEAKKAVTEVKAGEASAKAGKALLGVK